MMVKPISKIAAAIAPSATLAISAKAKQMKADRIIAILHDPPFDEMRRPSHMMEIIAESGADLCLYGHIHGAPNFKNLPDSLLGVPLCLTSSDYLDFKPYFICDLEAPHA